MQCNHCERVSPREARYCSTCRTPLFMRDMNWRTPAASNQNFCTSCGATLAPPWRPRVTRSDGERKQATILFSDVVDYTRWSARADSEDIADWIGKFKVVAEAIVQRHGGVVNQYAGDQVMALFGAATTMGHDAEHAVKAALELHAAVDQMPRPSMPPDEDVHKLHTGVDTGMVLVDEGDGLSGALTVFGDVINMASRLQKKADPGEVLLSQATHDEVAAHFECIDVGPVRVKGKDKPLCAYRVMRARPSLDIAARPLVGRDGQLSAFVALARSCIDSGRGQLVIVQGEVGIGKTRLATEYARRARMLGYACHSATVQTFGEHAGCDTVSELARSLLGIPLDAGKAPCLEAIERLSAAPNWNAGMIARLYGLLNVSAAPSPLALLAAMDQAARDSALDKTLRRLVADACAATPVLMLVEDIHWADVKVLAPLAAIASLTPLHPLLLLVTIRTSPSPQSMVASWRARLRELPLTEFHLSALSKAEAERMACGFPAPSDDIRHRCVERAGGKPLLLARLLEAAHTLGVMPELPGSVHALVQACVDQLERGDKAVLHAAAVLGEKFTLTDLQRVAGGHGPGCIEVADYFLKPDRDGKRLDFRHALDRDAVYASLRKETRKHLHVRAAEWFKPFDIKLAADHFRKVRDARALPAYLKAADGAVAKVDFRAALEACVCALRVSKSPSDRFEIRLKTARMLIETGQPAKAVKVCARAVRCTHEPAQRARGLIQQAAGLRLLDRISDGLASLREAQPLAEGAALIAELSQLHHLRGNLLFPLGQHDECKVEHELALTQAERADSIADKAAALGGLGDAQYLLGRMVSAHRRFRECVTLSRRHDLHRLEVANLPMVGWTLLYLNEMPRASKVGEKAVGLADRSRQLRAELLARTLIFWVDGLIRCHSGMHEEQFERALTVAALLGAKRFEGQLHAMSALISLREGQRALAQASANRALTICQEGGESGMKYIGPWIWGVQALVATDAAERNEALAEGESCLLGNCVSHNYILFRELAIDAALQGGDWTRAEGFCNRLRQYTAAQPLPYCDFLVERGLALSQWGRGRRGRKEVAKLVRLREHAAKHELRSAMPALDAALEGTARARVE